MPRYIRPHSLVPWKWLYHATIYPPPVVPREWLYHATIYRHPHSLVPREWLYHATIYPPPLSSSTGVIISCHDISTPTLYFHRSDYIMPQYIHSHSLVPQEWLYHARIYLPPLSTSREVIISCHDISTPTLYFHGSDYIMPRYIHPHSIVPREWLYHATIYPPPLASCMEVIISCHNIFTPHAIVPQEWLYHATIYPTPLSSSTGVIISCQDISTRIP